MNLSKKFFKFLKSEDKVLYIEDPTEDRPRHFYFAKMPYSDNIELLFMSYTYYDKMLMNDKLEYSGFYDKTNDKLYDIDYKLRNYILKLEWNNNPYKDMETLQKEYNKEVSDIITDYVLDNLKEFYDAAGDYESDVTKRSVYQHIMDDKFRLDYSYSYHNCDKADILNYLEQGKDYLYNIASEVIERDKEYIGKKLIDIDKTNEYIKEIYKDKNDSIHKKKEIIDSIQKGDYGSVHVFINKNNIDFDFRYDASVIKNYWDYSYLNTYNMSAPDRREYENLFGREDPHYEDIYKIEYRNKAIYEDKNFVKDEICITSDEKFVV